MTQYESIIEYLRTLVAAFEGVDGLTVTAEFAPPASEDDVVQAETARNKSFPPALRDFLKVHDGFKILVEAREAGWQRPVTERHFWSTADHRKAKKAFRKPNLLPIDTSEPDEYYGLMLQSDGTGQLYFHRPGEFLGPAPGNLLLYLGETAPLEMIQDVEIYAEKEEVDLPSLPLPPEIEFTDPNHSEFERLKLDIHRKLQRVGRVNGYSSTERDDETEMQDLNVLLPTHLRSPVDFSIFDSISPLLKTDDPDEFALSLSFVQQDADFSTLKNFRGRSLSLSFANPEPGRKFRGASFSGLELTTVERLWISSISHVQDWSFLAQAFPRLERFDLSWPVNSNYDSLFEQPIPFLDLSGARGLPVIKGSFRISEGIEKLWIASCGGGEMPHFRGGAGLKELLLSYSSFGDRIEIPPLPLLEELHLNRAGVRTLHGLQELPNLKRLDIESNSFEDDTFLENLPEGCWIQASGSFPEEKQAELLKRYGDRYRLEF